MTKRFRIEGEFEAEDIDDALAKLAEHFRRTVAEEEGTVWTSYMKISVLPKDHPSWTR